MSQPLTSLPPGVPMAPHPRDPALSVSDLDDEDLEWVHKHRGTLDERVRVIGIAARGQDTRPLVLTCYPLMPNPREALGPTSDAATNGTTKGGGAGEGECEHGGEPAARVPWPNHFWLACPNPVARVGRLEAHGFRRIWRSRAWCAPRPTARAVSRG